MTLRLLVGVTCAFTAFAQSTAGRFSGTVTDASSATVPGVKVAAVNTETGQKVAETTNTQGQFVLYPLQPGLYNVSMQKTGFGNYAIEGLRIEVSSSVVRNVTLEVGSTGQSVTVSADATVMETD